MELVQLYHPQRGTFFDLLNFSNYYKVGRMKIYQIKLRDTMCKFKKIVTLGAMLSVSVCATAGVKSSTKSNIWIEVTDSSFGKYPFVQVPTKAGLKNSSGVSKARLVPSYNNHLVCLSI